MATRQHQRLLALVAKRMAQLGYQVVARDGLTESLEGTTLPLPKPVGKHRPDVVGLASDGLLCIGEAKTVDDLGSRRTRQQLEDYLSSNEGGYPTVVLGYPQSAQGAVEAVLRSIGGLDSPQLILLAVPDELIDE